MLSKKRASFHTGHKDNYSILAPTLSPTLARFCSLEKQLQQHHQQQGHASKTKRIGP